MKVITWKHIIVFLKPPCHKLSSTITFYFSCSPFICFFHPHFRTSSRQITQDAPQPAASLPNTTTRVSSRGTSSICRSTTWWLFSGAPTLSSPWGSARWLGPLPPTTGPSTSRMISPCSPCAAALYAHSGRLYELLSRWLNFCDNK